MYRTDKTNNAVFSLCYHFITVVKYRRKVFINDEIISYTKKIINDIAESFDVEIVEQECANDHLHILFRTKPTLDMTGFINVLKGKSSKILRNKYKDFLKDKLWGNSFWSGSYFLATTGNVSIDILKKYVSKQKEKQEEIC
jgi:putative transposase